MTTAPTIAEIIEKHVSMEIESIDRMYLNLYVAGLQTPAAVAYFLREHRGATFASSALLGPMGAAFVKAMDDWIHQQRIDVHRFEKGERKDDITKARLAAWTKKEGILYVGTAQEKARVVRTEKRVAPNKKTYPWLVMSTAMVKHYYIYIVDADFGPFFIKICTYFPYTAKVCLNGHEYLKRQLAKEKVSYSPLDNGLLRCSDASRAQKIADGLSPSKIRSMIWKWLDRMPHPFTPKDHAAGYAYSMSVLQAEFSLTQTLDRPLSGRHFFDQVIRDNLLLGSPSRVGVIFDRKVIKTTPGTFRTRLLTRGMVPTVHYGYKHSDIKQYHKSVPDQAGSALRTECTINDTRDFRIGRNLDNLPKLREVGFTANRRLQHVQCTGCDRIQGEVHFRQTHDPVLTTSGQRIAGLPFGDIRVHTLLAALTVLAVLPGDFRARQLADLLNSQPTSVGQYTPGRTTYDLRRLVHHGLIERIPGRHAYRVTADGLRIATFYTRTYDRLVMPGFAALFPKARAISSPVRTAAERLDAAIAEMIKDPTIVAA